MFFQRKYVCINHKETFTFVVSKMNIMCVNIYKMVHVGLLSPKTTMATSLFTCGTNKCNRKQTLQCSDRVPARSGQDIVSYTFKWSRMKVQAAKQNHTKNLPHTGARRRRHLRMKEERGQGEGEWVTVTFRVVFMCGWGHYPKRLGKTTAFHAGS